MYHKTKEYRKIHNYLNYNFSKTNKCSNVDCEGNCYRYEWALIKGREYSYDINDYIELCTKCHRVYDLTGRKVSKSTREKMSKAQNKRNWSFVKSAKYVSREEAVKMYRLRINGESYRSIGRLLNFHHNTVKNSLDNLYNYNYWFPKEIKIS